MRNVNVLWLDDEHDNEELESLIENAKLQGIHLFGFKSVEAGFEALENNLEFFDAILLDGLFYLKKNQEKDVVNISSIGEAIKRIHNLESKKVFPWFVLSGKTSFTGRENDLLIANRKRCYIKFNKADNNDLFKEIKIAADEQPTYQLKHRYSSVLNICDEKYIGEDHFSKVFSLIEDIEYKDRISSTQEKFISIRMRIEGLFSMLIDLAIIPKELKGDISPASRFLANIHSGYEHNENFFHPLFENESYREDKKSFIHPLISNNIHQILKVTHDAAHYNGNKFNIGKYLPNSNSDYLYRSTIYLLFDVLLWFKDFIDGHLDVEENKRLWRKKETDEIKIDDGSWIEGEIIKIKENGWAVFQPNNEQKYIDIPDFKVIQYELKENNLIKITMTPSPDHKKTFVGLIEKK